MVPKKTLFIFFIIILSLFCSDFAFARELQVGVSPLLLDLGNVTPGESIVGSFFIVTSSDDEIIVKLESFRSNFDFFRKSENVDIINYVSEEDSSSWVFFPSNPYVLKSEDEELMTSAGAISGWRKVNFVLNVPFDAEPCYHALKIHPTPYLAKESGSGVSIIALTAITVKFNVEGECNIGGKILDVMQGDSANSNAIDLDIYFQNMGSATVLAYSPKLTVYLENGTLIDQVTSGYVYVTPNDIGLLNVRIDSTKITPGKYILNTTVVYGANITSKEIELVIIEPKIVKSQPNIIIKDTYESNIFWFFLVIILIVAYILYKKDNFNNSSTYN